MKRILFGRLSQAKKLSGHGGQLKDVASEPCATGQDAAIIRRLYNTHDYCDYIVADNEELKLLDHWRL